MAHPTLQPLDLSSPHTFTTPTKRIHDAPTLDFFLHSTAYRDILTWLFQLNRSMYPTIDASGKITPCSLTSPPPYPPTVLAVQKILSALEDLIEQAPLSTGPRRFGNVAFREWCRLAERDVPGLLRLHLSDAISQNFPPKPNDSASSSSSNDSQTPSPNDALLNELSSYLLSSLGSPQRLDYGTGHELSFLLFLGCLAKLSLFPAHSERALVMGLIHPYILLIRKLILKYTLEPAGSHGVWGLDDHSFLPYIFGSAQLGPPLNLTLPEPLQQPVFEGSSPTAPPPSSVTDKPLVKDWAGQNMYFSAIQFIYDVKRGAFWEHSPVLYDVSGIKAGWGKINKGMLRMFGAEVLGKLPVVQHVGFGSLFVWDRDVEGEGEGEGGWSSGGQRAREAP